MSELRPRTILLATFICFPQVVCKEKHNTNDYPECGIDPVMGLKSREHSDPEKQNEDCETAFWRLEVHRIRSDERATEVCRDRRGAAGRYEASGDRGSAGGTR